MYNLSLNMLSTWLAMYIIMYKSFQYVFGYLSTIFVVSPAGSVFVSPFGNVLTNSQFNSEFNMLSPRWS